MVKLLLRARTGRMRPHFPLGGGRRFVGRTHDPKMGKNGGWPMSAEPEEVICDGDHELEMLHDYRQAVRDGDVWAADEATAARFGVTFDPDFGGEEPEDHPAHAPETKSEAPHGAPSALPLPPRTPNFSESK